MSKPLTTLDALELEDANGYPDGEESVVVWRADLLATTRALEAALAELENERKSNQGDAMATKKKPEVFVVVRSYSAGVHCGVLVSATPNGGRETVVLKNVRRLWRWRGANSLNEVALNGVAEEHTRLSEPVPENTVSDIVERIVCSPSARANLERSRWAP